jgi:DNA-directed RNA polymerase subunit RPC12/RpoP
MSDQIVRAPTSYKCAHCGEPLSFTSAGIQAWRVKDQFACNEFCADGISADADASGTALRQLQAKAP